MSKNTATRFKLIPAVYLFLMKENQVLLLQRANTGYEDGNYSVIAGHVDENESATAAIVREAREEAGIEVRAQDLQFAHLMHRVLKDQSDRMDLYFMCKKWSGTVENMEPAKCSQLKWFEVDALPDNMIACVRLAFSHTQRGEQYSEFDH